MPAGATSKYEPAYCREIVQHMADGASATSFAASIEVCRDTISEWAKVHPEFSVALKIGKAKCAAWWEQTGRNNAKTGTGSSSMVMFGLKNMGADDWTDKSHLDVTTAGKPVRTFADMYASGTLDTDA